VPRRKPLPAIPPIVQSKTILGALDDTEFSFPQAFPLANTLNLSPQLIPVASPFRQRLINKTTTKRQAIRCEQDEPSPHRAVQPWPSSKAEQWLLKRQKQRSKIVSGICFQSPKYLTDSDFELPVGPYTNEPRISSRRPTTIPNRTSSRQYSAEQVFHHGEETFNIVESDAFEQESERNKT
jgi:hypothetical protein